MNYDECVAWMGRYCAAKHAAPRLREKLAEETRRAEYAEILRKAPAGTAETNLESAIASINARREKLAAQLDTVSFTLRYNADLSDVSQVYSSDGTLTLNADTAYQLDYKF